MTQPLKANPAALRGYAGQLERNADDFDALKRYCDFYCDDAGGLTGLLWATAVPAVNILAEAQYMLLPAARDSLYNTARNLADVATGYEQSDESAANRIGAVMPDWPGPGAQGAGATGPGQTGDFSDPAQVEPPPPAKNNDMQKKIDKTLKVVGEIDRWLEKVLKFSLRKQVFPWLTGDWGKVREMAEAYGSLGGDQGLMAIDKNLRSGMASLSSLWDGPAADAFEHHIIDGWGKALAAAADICKASKEGLEALAAQAEHLYTGLDNLLTAFLAWVVGRVLRAVSLLLRMRVWEAAGIIEEIWSNIMLIMDLLETWLNIWPETVKHLIELGEAELAAAKSAISMFRGDLAVI